MTATAVVVISELLKIHFLEDSLQRNIWDTCLCIWWSSRCRIKSTTHKICTTITSRWHPSPSLMISSPNIAGAKFEFFPCNFRFIFQKRLFHYLHIFPFPTPLHSLDDDDVVVCCFLKRIYFHNFRYQTLKQKRREMWARVNT